ncbi:MAG: twin-arginine translocation signal domain-containing protein, partial [Dehalococcoidia bacterium]|nr:twin-arginine translocation signal domain-containing protein [Dehalococcoidia bacterium]
MGITRRQFIQLTGVSAAGAVAFSACTPSRSELLVESRARMPEDLVTGIDTWYATICRMCPSGCGIIVRVMEGRAKKIEGNPAYPVNRGKLCARGQSGLQALYHPDRIRGPLKRTGPRGSGQFEPVSWDTAMGDLSGRLKPPSPAGRPG